MELYAHRDEYIYAIYVRYYVVQGLRYTCAYACACTYVVRAAGCGLRAKSLSEPRRSSLRRNAVVQLTDTVSNSHKLAFMPTYLLHYEELRPL